MKTLYTEHALLADGWARGVAIDIDDTARIVNVVRDPPGATTGS